MPACTTALFERALDRVCRGFSCDLLQLVLVQLPALSSPFSSASRLRLPQGQCSDLRVLQEGGHTRAPTVHPMAVLALMKPCARDQTVCQHLSVLHLEQSLTLTWLAGSHMLWSPWKLFPLAASIKENPSWVLLLQ